MESRSANSVCVSFLDSRAIAIISGLIGPLGISFPPYLPFGYFFFDQSKCWLTQLATNLHNIIFRKVDSPYFANALSIWPNQVNSLDLGLKLIEPVARFKVYCRGNFGKLILML